MPIKSYNDGRRLVSKTDISSKIVTGQSELSYHVADSFSTKVQDAYITFKYYRWGGYMGTTRFYWHNISAGNITELSVSSSNGFTYQPMTTQHHTGSGQSWLTATINLASFESTGWGRFVVRHQTSSNTSSFYTGDFQMDHIEIHSSVGSTIDLDPDLYRQNSANQYWQRSNYNTSWSSGMTWTDVIATENSTNFWCYDSGGTGSTNTGNTLNSDGSSSEYYIYTEVSGAASRYAYLQTKYQYDLYSGTSQ